jgi:predicted enzyme related to lactoylglutathione lyase
MALFWAAALDGYQSDEAVHSVKSDSGGPTLYFQEVPEAKQGKNRIHLDLTSTDPKGDVFRIERNGGKVIREVEEGGHSWVVMADPEGNEFCVVVAS